MTVTLIGGDARALAAARRLRQAGHCVKCAGLSLLCAPDFASHSIEDASRHSDAILLPLPYTKDGATLYAPFSPEPIPLSSLHFARGSRIFCGKADFALRAQAEAGGWHLEDYANWEAFAVGNAVPSAEGAISIAMQQLQVNLLGLRVCLLGFGRIARHLCRLLCAFGARVTVLARKSEQRLLAQSMGAQALPLTALPRALPDCDLLYNTVPSLLLDGERLALLPRSALLIDLASAPGGIDFAAAAAQGLRCIWALSLPATYAPQSAGTLLAELLLAHEGWEDITKERSDTE